MKKKLLSILIGASLLLGTTPTFAMPGDITTDPADDFSMLYDYSEYWGIKTNNSDKLGGDSGRFQRSSSALSAEEAYQYLTYTHNNPQSVQVLLYYTNADFINAINISCSPDDEDYTSVSYTVNAYDGCSGSWSGSYLKVDALPKGTRYIRIEMDKTASTATGCAIGEVQITEGEAAYENTVIPEAGANVIIREDCENKELIYAEEGTWNIDKSNPDKFGEDSRILRAKDEKSSLIWNFSKLVEVRAVLYHHNGVLTFEDFMVFEYSNDNEEWFPIEAKYSKTGMADWFKVTTTLSVPEAEFFRATILPTGNVWGIGFGSFDFVTKSPYELKDGDITVSNGVASASYTLITNEAVYEKVGMFLATYDENGILTGMTAKTFDAPLGENQLESEIAISKGSKTVRVYFLNGLWGLHQICETQEKKI